VSYANTEKERVELTGVLLQERLDGQKSYAESVIQSNQAMLDSGNQLTDEQYKMQTDALEAQIPTLNSLIMHYEYMKTTVKDNTTDWTNYNN